jgi:hypothetical protein
MQAFHTAGEPPRRGSTSRPNSGWTRKSRKAEANTEPVKAPMTSAG